MESTGNLALSERFFDPVFPLQPFEKIALALSGGGFRATTYGLGVLSQLHSIKIDEDKSSTLLEKVVYVSGTSGGTITLSVYAACIHKNIAFEAFYQHLNQQLHGEELVHDAIGLLTNDNEWLQLPRSRNVINAFAKVYHENLFSIIGPAKERVLRILTSSGAHLKEVCFNATEFYTGLPFKFQVPAGGWSKSSGGKIGNNNIRINTEMPEALTTLEQLRLADVLACSSCFPTGFEPMVYPRDFTYNDGPGEEILRDAFDLRTYSTDEGEEPDPRSPRAIKEKVFADKGEFSIMDGGIVDNQGLDALMEANERKDEDDDGSGNRFGLVMICDVASFYMEPYINPEINTSKKWMRKSLDDYWNLFTSMVRKATRLTNLLLIAAFIIAILFVLPLIFIEQGIAEIMLAITGIVLVIIAFIIKRIAPKLISSDSTVGSLARYDSVAMLVHDKLPPEKNFRNRVLEKMSEYIQLLPLGVILQMILARAMSSQVMIGEIFLKHVRRLIFNQLYTLPKLKYRRMNNVIYQLTFTNDNNRRRPAFESEEETTKTEDEARRKAFLEEWENSVQLTDDMKSVSELAYNTGTTLWFEESQEQDDPFKNNRRALLATGQFTTCYNLIGYTLSLKHSRNFDRLDAKYQSRVISILAQLKLQMQKFASDPFWMEKEYAAASARGVSEHTII